MTAKTKNLHAAVLSCLNVALSQGDEYMCDNNDYDDIGSELGLDGEAEWKKVIVSEAEGETPEMDPAVIEAIAASPEAQAHLRTAVARYIDALWHYNRNVE